MRSARHSRFQVNCFHAYSLYDAFTSHQRWYSILILICIVELYKQLKESLLGHRDQFKHFYHDAGTPAITALCYESKDVLIVGDEFGSLYRVHLASNSTNLMASHSDGIFSIVHSAVYNITIAIVGFNRVAIHTPSRTTMRIMQRNIRCIQISPKNHHTLSTELVWIGYADSSIEAYDIQSFSNSALTELIPVNCIYHAHNRKKNMKGQQGTCSQLVFDPMIPYHMYSVGLPDKYTYRNGNADPIAIFSNTHSSRSFSSISIHSPYLFVTCMNGRIYRYLTSNPSIPPVIFNDPALRIDSFHVRCALNVDGKYITCGSSNGGAFIWSVEHPEWSPIRLMTSNVEVSLILWNPFQETDFEFPLELCCATDAAEVQLWGRNGNDPQPWTAQLVPFSLEFIAFECDTSTHDSTTIVSDITNSISALTHLPSLVDLSSTINSLSQSVDNRLSSVSITKFDVDYDVMLKENTKPNNTFGTPIKFPLPQKNSHHIKDQIPFINKNKRQSPR